ncbi:MAG: hypothetical protein M3N13_10015 [Candidatus Eremiobacteraeota bacterium]|nr:hypothetical protein [Candidatus Eremiobacteraeota bacterium]
MSITRGELIRTGLGGAIVLGVAGCASRNPDDERVMLGAIAGCVLAGAATGSSLGPLDIQRAVDGIYTAVAGLPSAVQGEVRQLFAILRIPLTRFFLAGVKPQWSAASVADVSAFLTRWRTSDALLFRSGYQALHQLVLAGWYGDDRAWQATGYPGPPKSY